MATPGKAQPAGPKKPEEEQEKPVRKEPEIPADEEGHVESGPTPPDDRGLLTS